jgi:hypothetical protein
MQRIDNTDESYWKVAITGPGGTGKTTLGVSAPKPLIVLSERQGLPSIKQAAKRLGVPVPAVVYVEHADDYRGILRALRGPKDEPFRVKDADGEVVMELPVEQWPETVVIDSLTDACDVMVNQIRDQSPPRKGRDGLPVDAQRFWGVLIDRCNGLIKGFRDLPMHVVFLCLLSDKTKEDDNGNMIERVIQPKLATHAMAQSLCAAVNVMGYTYRTVDKERQPVYGVRTMGPESMLTKPCEPLHKNEVADLGSWFARLSGNLAELPEFPLGPESLDGAEPDPEPEPEAQPERTEDEAPPLCSACGDFPVVTEGEICEECEKAIPGPEPEPEPKAEAKPKRGAKKAGAK